RATVLRAHAAAVFALVLAAFPASRSCEAAQPSAPAVQAAACQSNVARHGPLAGSVIRGEATAYPKLCRRHVERKFVSPHERAKVGLHHPLVGEALALRGRHVDFVLGTACKCDAVVVPLVGTGSDWMVPY